MNKKHKIILIAFAVSIIFLCVAIYINTNYKPEINGSNVNQIITLDSDGSYNTEISSASDFVIDISSLYLDNRYTVDGENLISKSVTYPELRIINCSYTDKINGAIKAFAENLIKIDSESKHSALDGFSDTNTDFDPWEFTADFEIGVYGHYMSVLFDCGDYCGGADSSHYFKTVCYDLNTGNNAGITDVFGDVNELVRNEFASLTQKNSESCYDDSDEILGTYDFSDSFYFDGSNIIVYINPGVISPSVFGIIRTQIPQNMLQISS